jgi:hypothetical protein
MPYARCPVCQNLFHLLVRAQSLADWEREYVRDANGTALLKCFRCWVDLRPGHRVTLRVVPDDLAGVLFVGDEGVVESTGDGEGSEIVVRFGATLSALKRDDVFYIPGQPNPDARGE